MKLLADPSIYDWSLRHLIPAIRHRPSPRVGWSQRIYLYELVPDPGALRSKAAQQAGLNGFILHRPAGCLLNHSIYIRTRSPTVGGLRLLIPL